MLSQGTNPERNPRNESMPSAAAVALKKPDRAAKPSIDMKLIASIGNAGHELTLGPMNASSSACTFAVGSLERKAEVEAIAPGAYSILLGTRSYEVQVEQSGDDFVVVLDGRRFEIAIQDPRRSRGRAGGVDSGGLREIASPMPGKVIRVMVETGDEVQPGQGLLVVEAMKMQNEIKSPGAGKIKTVHVSEGSAVAAGEVMVVVE